MRGIGAQRTYFIGKIRVDAPLHIGIGRQIADTEGYETDQPVLLDREGKPFIPATSLGGLMRSIAENLVSVLDGWQLQDLVSLFGMARQKREGGRGGYGGTGGALKTQEGELRASFSKLRIRHAQLAGEWRGWTEVRDSVGIDRKTGAARARIKFDYEVAPPGLEFGFWAELRDGTEEDKALLALVLTAMEILPISVGAKGGSGLGWLQLSLEKVVELNLTDRECLTCFLLEKDEFVLREKGTSFKEWREKVLQGRTFRVKANNAYHRIPQVMVFTYHLKVEDPLLVANKRIDPTVAFDWLVARRGEDLRQRGSEKIDTIWIGVGEDLEKAKDWRPIVPGSSMRGVFRSHCERILRTLSWHYAREHSGGQETEKIKREYKRRCAAAVDPWQTNENLGKEVEEKWTESMKGDTPEEQKWHDAGEKIAQIIWEKSDLAERVFGSTFWKSLITVSEAYIPANEVNNWRDMIFDHLAVERFSGGAMEGKKFDAVPVTKGTFEGQIAVWGDELWVLGLVALFFKDLAEGLIRFGAGKTRGYGKLRGKLTRVDAYLLAGTKMAEHLGVKDVCIGAWHHKRWVLGDAQFPNCLKKEELRELEELLTEGVKALNELVKEFEKETDQQDGEST